MRAGAGMDMRVGRSEGCNNRHDLESDMGKIAQCSISYRIA